MVYKKVVGEGGSGGMDEEGRIIFSMSEVGAVIEGVYKDVKEIPGYQGKGKQNCYTFEMADGRIEEVIGFGLMDHIMGNVDKGVRTKITYNGKIREYHNCTIEVDDGEANGEDTDF